MTRPTTDAAASLPLTRYDEAGLNAGSPALRPDAPLLTPTAAFFRRNHAPPPAIDAGRWRLRVDGLVERPADFTLDALRALPAHTVDATLVCAGLRRSEFMALGPLNGELPWRSDAASTGRWQGIRLRDVLEVVGVDARAAFVAFEGLDGVERDGRRFGFGASLPLTRAVQEDVLLATHLNDHPLPQEHGFPLRVVVPGVIGARCVKWLGHIELRETPSENYFQTRAYRVARDAPADDPRDVRHGRALDDIPRNAVIAAPTEGAHLRAGAVPLHGWAIGEGGAALEAVEISVDGGQRWTAARLRPGATRWTWTLWEHTVELSRGDHTLLARARDALGTMPASLDAVRNVKGYGNNVWFRVDVHVT